MDYPKFIVSNQMEYIISIQRVICFHNNAWTESIERQAMLIESTKQLNSIGWAVIHLQVCARVHTSKYE